MINFSIIKKISDRFGLTESEAKNYLAEQEQKIEFTGIALPSKESVEKWQDSITNSDFVAPWNRK